MPYYRSAFHHTVFIDFQRLLRHKFDGFRRVFEIIFLARVTLGYGGGKEFQIGKVNVYVSVDFAQDFGFFVAVRVVNDGDFGLIDFKRGDYFVRILRRGYEIDIFRARGFEFAENIRKFLYRNFFAA